MGAWGYEPWDSDEAADWFAIFFDTLKVKEIEQLVEEFDHTDECQYEPIRAAAYVVQCLCNAYVWPMEDDDNPKAMITKLIKILENMIDPSLEEWTFLEKWDYQPKIIASVNTQLTQLGIRREEWAGCVDC